MLLGHAAAGKSFLPNQKKAENPERHRERQREGERGKEREENVVTNAYLQMLQMSKKCGKASVERGACSWSRKLK